MMDKTELRRIKRHLMSWSTGQFEVGPANQDSCSTIVVADPAHLADLLDTDLVGDNTVVLAPEGHGADPSRVVGFAGTLDEPNAEMSIGYDFFLQTQDYATSPFMSVLGPTLVRVTGPDDLELFLADADRARKEGVFPDIAVVPAVRIADLPGLGAGPGVDGPQLRLYVNAEGEISTSIGGCSLGRVGDTLASLRANWDRRNAASTAPCAVCLGAVLPEADRTRELLARPWLGRYLAAVDGLRMLATREIVGLRVSGFGQRLNPALDHHPDSADAATPLLFWNDESGYVYEPASGRTFQVNLAAATAVEALLVTGSAEQASEYASPRSLAAVDRFFTESGVTLTGIGSEVAV